MLDPRYMPPRRLTNGRSAPLCILEELSSALCTAGCCSKCSFVGGQNPLQLPLGITATKACSLMQPTKYCCFFCRGRLGGGETRTVYLDSRTNEAGGGEQWTGSFSTRCLYNKVRDFRGFCVFLAQIFNIFNKTKGSYRCQYFRWRQNRTKKVNNATVYRK
jgi:hypothetical protein